MLVIKPQAKSDFLGGYKIKPIDKNKRTDNDWLRKLAPGRATYY